MKLSVSNIAWDEAENDAVLALLAGARVSGIEIAPTKLWPDWRGASRKAAEAAAHSLKSRGFDVPALQAILFGKPELSVFGDAPVRAALLDHIEFVAEIAAGFGAGVLVFGSPKNRDPGELPVREALARGAEFFRAAGERCAPYGVCLCLEPNPARYACRFMTSWRDVKDMATRVDHENVGIHLDAACIELEGDSAVDAVSACAGRIAHFHATEPDLGDFTEPQMPHAEIGAALRAAEYDNWISIEMRRSNDPLESIEKAVAEVWRCYG
ncbi:MAG: sugar phosphate isomerase/epimerase [Parvularculaceae bacterium]|nr:sugar phosphate isomerase/epimerase [Parvularculaceae bacterium]